MSTSDAGPEATRAGATSTVPLDHETLTRRVPNDAPMGDILIVDGTTVEREPDWRGQVDIGTAPRHVVYSAGYTDGYHAAYAELREFAQLVLAYLEVAGLLDRSPGRAP